MKNKIIYAAKPKKITDYRPKPVMNRARWIALGVALAIAGAGVFYSQAAEAAHVTLDDVRSEAKIQEIIRMDAATGYPVPVRIIHDNAEQEVLDYLRSEPPLTEAIEGGVIRNKIF